MRIKEENEKEKKEREDVERKLEESKQKFRERKERERSLFLRTEDAKKELEGTVRNKESNISLSINSLFFLSLH